MRTTVTELADRLRTEADAWAFLEELRWPNGPKCPTCHGRDVYLIIPKNGVSRRTTSGSQSQRRTWACRPCRRQFSATSGTMMHGTRIPIRVWVLVIFEMAASKNGVAALEIERKYGLCARSAWFLMHRIRESMRWDWIDRWENAVVLADEAYIGGNPKWRHESKRTSTDGRGTDKVPVVSILNESTGEVRSHVVTDVSGHTLGQILMGNVDPDGSTLVTDQWRGYLPVGQFFSKHETVDHSEGEYVRAGYTTNPLESFFSQLKRSIDGTHHHVSSVHLHRYVAEHDWRRSNCRATDADRMAMLVESGEGRRLTYEQVKG